MTEDNMTEFKREFINDLNREVIAFANTNGGEIYIGINDDGSVCGVDDIVATELQCSQHIANTIKPDITMFIKYDRIEKDQKQILKITVNKGSMYPYYIASKGIRPEGVYLRVGSSSVPASVNSILNMIKENSGTSYESTRSLNQNLTFIQTESEFERVGLPFGDVQKKSLGVIGRDGLYTNLALLLSDQCEHSIKFAYFEGVQKQVFLDRHEFTGSLFRQIADLLDTIDRFNKLSSPKLEGIKREDIRDYPEEAIREAVLNAVIHRDYALNGYTLVSMFADRIEILSLGGLLHGVEISDIMMGVSIQRNPQLANVFYRLHFIEAYGTGIYKMKEAYAESTRNPRFECAPNSFKVTLPKLKGITCTPHSTDDGEKIIINALKECGTIKRNDVEQMLNTSQATAVRIIKKMLDSHQIQKRGSGKATVYSLVS